MIPPQLDFRSLTLDEAILFAYRYHLIDDCQTDGTRIRLVIGNQSAHLTEEELPVFLESLLRRYERATQVHGNEDGLHAEDGLS